MLKPIARTVFGLTIAATAFASLPAPLTAELGNAPLQLSHYKGKVVVIQFLYTDCQHCQATARMLSKLQKDLAPSGLQVLGVAFNDEAQDSQVLREFVSQYASFPVARAKTEDVRKYLGIPVVSRLTVPQIVVIDRSGTVRAQSKYLGSAELQDESYLRTLVGNLLKQKATTR